MRVTSDTFPLVRPGRYRIALAVERDSGLPDGISGMHPEGEPISQGAHENRPASFLQACGTPSATAFTPLSGRATITGVGFFGFKHGQRGVAPNAIELHLVLRFANRSCGR